MSHTKRLRDTEYPRSRSSMVGLCHNNLHTIHLHIFCREGSAHGYLFRMEVTSAVGHGKDIHPG